MIHPGLAGVSKSDLKEKLATNLKVRESRTATILFCRTLAL